MMKHCQNQVTKIFRIQFYYIDNGKLRFDNFMIKHQIRNNIDNISTSSFIKHSNIFSNTTPPKQIETQTEVSTLELVKGLKKHIGESQYLGHAEENYYNLEY